MNQPILLELRAIGPEPDQRWRYRIEKDSVIRLGRAPDQGWAVPWDMRISREHADLMFEGTRMFVSCLGSARNPAYYLGKPTKKFAVEPGGEFRIGATTFRLQRVASDSAAEGSGQGESHRAVSASLKLLQAKMRRGDARFQSSKAMEQNLQAVLELIDHDGQPRDGGGEAARPPSERDTESTSKPQVGTATPDILLRQLAEEQRGDQEARRRAEEQAQRHKSEVRVLRTAVDKLREQMKREVAAKQQAQADADRTSGQQLEATEQARRQAEEIAHRSQEEADKLRRQLEELQTRMKQEIEAVQKAEAEANRMALQEARAAAQRDAEEQARLVAETAKQLEQQKALHRAEQEARRLAEKEAQRLREEGQHKGDDEARRKAEEEAERARLEAEKLREKLELLEGELESLAATQQDSETRMKQLVESEKQRRQEEAAQRRGDNERLRLAEEAVARHRAEAEALRQEVASLTERLLEEAEAQKRAEEDARRAAQHEAQRKAEEEARQQAEEQARKRLEEEAERRRAEAETLTSQVAALQNQLQQTAESKLQAQREAQRLAQEEAKRAEAERLQRQAELDTRKELEQESARRREEAKALKCELESLNSRLREEVEALQQAEERAGQIHEQRRAETEGLKAELQRLQRQAERETAEQRKVEDELRELVSKEERRIAEERARRMREEAARQRAEAETAQRQHELEQMKREMAQLQDRWKKQFEAQQRAEKAVSQLAVEEAKRRAEEGQRRVREEEARHIAEEEAARRQAEVETLRAEVERLHNHMKAESSAHEDALEEAHRIARQEAERKSAEAARKQAELDALRDAQQQAKLQKERSRSLRRNIESIRSKMHRTEKRRADLRRKAGTRDSTEFDPYYTWLAIPPDEQPADHYRLLGLVRFENDWEVIERSADRQMAYLRLHQLGKHAGLCQKLLNEVAAAKVTLLDSEKKKNYDDKLWADIEERERDLQPDEWAKATHNVDGTAFQDYILLDHVASGETGQMFFAQHKTLGRMVALNILSEEAAQYPESVQRFRCKSQILARWSHPSLIPVYDAGEQENIHYLVMEFIDGSNLVELLKEQGTLNIELVMNIISQAAEGLGFLHEQGVIHRNVSPKNLLVDKQNAVKLIGLGQALYTEKCRLPGLDTSTEAADTGPIGSFDYMAPEQALHSGRVDGRADIYSLGCTMFTALTAQVVFPVDNPAVQMVAERTEAPPKLTRFRDDISDELGEVFQRMVHPDRDQRYGSMAEVVAALKKLPSS